MMPEESANVIEEGVSDRARHARDVLTALAEERVGPGALGVRFQEAVDAEMFTGGPEQRGDEGGEREHQEHAVAPGRVLDAHVAEAEAEAPVLVVSEGLFDREPFGIQTDNRLGVVGATGGQDPRLLHALALDGDDRSDRHAMRGQSGIEDLRGATVGRDPLGGGARLALPAPAVDAPAEADDEVEAEKLRDLLLQSARARRWGSA